jgi:hypothetical protein
LKNDPEEKAISPNYPDDKFILSPEIPMPVRRLSSPDLHQNILIGTASDRYAGGSGCFFYFG